MDRLIRILIGRNLLHLRIAFAIPFVTGCVSIGPRQQDFKFFPDDLTCIVEDSRGERDITVGFKVGERVSDVVARNAEVLGIGKKPMRIYLARPKKADASEDEILPVDWTGCNQFGNSQTDYPIQAGDRLYVCKRINFHGGGILCRVTVWDRLCQWIESLAD